VNEKIRYRRRRVYAQLYDEGLRGPPQVQPEYLERVHVLYYRRVATAADQVLRNALREYGHPPSL